MTTSGLLKKEGADYLMNRPLLSNEFINILKNSDDYEYAKSIGGLV